MSRSLKSGFYAGISHRSPRPCLGLAMAWLCLLPAVLHAQTFTWTGGGTDDLFNNSANWAGANVPGTAANQAKDYTLVFGAESGVTPNYVNILNQANNQAQQNVGTFIFNSDAGAYTMNRAVAQEYSLNGVSAGSPDPGDFNAIINQSSNLITFNVTINSNAQGGNSPMARAIWDSGTGGLLFTETTFFNSNAKDLSLRGSADIRFTAATALNNITGSSAVMEVRMDPAATVEVDGVITDMPGIRVSSGTLYLTLTGGVDIIDDRGAASRRTQLDMRGGTLLFADSGTQLAEFKGTMTLSRDSNVTGLVNSNIDLGTGGNTTIQFANSSGATWEADTRLSIRNWKGTPVTGGGDDQIYYGTSAAGLTSGQLSHIRFIDPTGLAPGHYGAIILASGEIVPGDMLPIPEPGTVAAGMGLAGFFLWRARRELLAVCRRTLGSAVLQ